jgi:hypothetical protein
VEIERAITKGNEGANNRSSRSFGINSGREFDNRSGMLFCESWKGQARRGCLLARPKRRAHYDFVTIARRIIINTYML